MTEIGKNKVFMSVLDSLKLKVEGLHDWSLFDHTSTGKEPKIVFIFLINNVTIECTLEGKPLRDLLDSQHTDASIIVIGSIQPTNIVAWLKHHYIEKLREQKKSSNKFTFVSLGFR